jgi:beta-lactamase class A
VVAFAWTTLDGRLLAGERSEQQFYAASTMKLAVLIEAYRQFDAGCLRPLQTVLVKSDFRSVLTGEPYRVDPDDVDPELASLTGTELTLVDLIERMITVSSNEATNLILEVVGVEHLGATLGDVGVTASRVCRPIGDAKAEAAGLSNRVSPLDLCRLLCAIEQGEAASPASCAQMLAVLGRQRYRDEIPAGVLAGVRTANKNGWITGLRHDACLVWPPDAPGYCLAVCTSGFAVDEEARGAIQKRSRECYSNRALNLAARAPEV